MTKTQATARAGSQRALAALLGVTPQAVSKWPGDSIPALQLYRLRELKPRWFAQLRREARALAEQTQA